jgi:hypothetical protein
MKSRTDHSLLERTLALAFTLLGAGCGADPWSPEPEGLLIRGAAQKATEVPGTFGPTAPISGTAVLVPPAELKVKLNDNLAALTRIVLPALAEQHGLERVSLPSLTLFRGTKAEIKESTSGFVDVLLDASFACHNNRSLVLDLQDLMVQTGIDADAVSANISGSAASGSDTEITADLDDLRITGRVVLDWPKDTSTYCDVFGTNHHVEVPFTIEGATLEARAEFARAGGGVNLEPLTLTRLALRSVDLDNDAFNFVTDALLIVADLAASAAQDLGDGPLTFDHQPEVGICNSPRGVRQPGELPCLRAVELHREEQGHRRAAGVHGRDRRRRHPRRDRGLVRCFPGQRRALGEGLHRGGDQEPGAHRLDRRSGVVGADRLLRDRSDPGPDGA